MYVYLIGNTSFKWYKLGVSRRDLTVRMKEVQKGVPFSVDMLGHWNTEQAFFVERLVQERFWRNHLRGEWSENLDIVEVAEFVQGKARLFS